MQEEAEITVLIRQKEKRLMSCLRADPAEHSMVGVIKRFLKIYRPVHRNRTGCDVSNACLVPCEPGDTLSV